MQRIKNLLATIALCLLTGIALTQDIPAAFNQSLEENNSMFLGNGFSFYGTDVRNERIIHKYEQKTTDFFVQYWMLYTQTEPHQIDGISVFTQNKAYHERILGMLYPEPIELKGDNDKHSLKITMAGAHFVLSYQQFENTGGPVYEIHVSVAQ